MRRLPALLGILLVVVALVAPTAQGVAPTQTATAADGDSLPRVTTVDNLTNHLTIPGEDIEQSEYGSTGIDVGAAVSLTSQRLYREHDARTFEQRFFRATNESARTRLVRSELDSIEQRQQTLQQRQQQQLQQYADGTASVESVMRTRALIDAEARELARTLDTIDRVERTEPAFTMTSRQQTRLENIRGEIRVLRGPVGERLGQTFTGETQPNAVYVMASTQDYMFATTTGQSYIRETHLASARDPTAEDQFVMSNADPLRAANTRAEVLYPWLYSQQLPSVNTFGTSSIYRLTANHPSGQLTTYIDGGTTDVFHESQQLQLSTIRTSETRVTVNESVRLEVTRTYETGPIHVAVQNNDTGEPVTGTVAVGGHQVGTTDNSGTLWTVEPRGSYSVTVQTQSGTNVSVAVLQN
jgi:hypothetical protein